MKCFTLDNVRLGAFLVLGLALVVATVLFFTVRDRPRDEILVVTYFDEAVTGLETDSPVRYRGVQVGRVDHITIAPDKVHVEVLMALHLDVLARLGFNRHEAEARMGGNGLLAADGLRATLQGNVITGRLFVQLDFIRDPPPPFQPTDFRPEYAYLPAAPSSLKEIEGHLTAVLAHLPKTLTQLDGLLTRFDAQLAAADLPGLVTDLRGTLTQLDLGGLSKELRQAVTDTDLPGLGKTLRTSLTTMAARIESVGKGAEALLAPEGALATLATEAGQTLTTVRTTLEQAKAGETTADLRTGAGQLVAAMKQIRLLLDDWRGLGDEAQAALRDLRRLSGTITDEPESLLFGPRDAREKD